MARKDIIKFTLAEGEPFSREHTELLITGGYRIKTIKVYPKDATDIPPEVYFRDPKGYVFDNGEELVVVEAKYQNGVLEYNMAPFSDPQVWEQLAFCIGSDHQCEYGNSFALMTYDYELERYNPNYQSQLDRIEIQLERMNPLITWSCGCNGEYNKKHVCGIISDYFENLDGLIDYIVLHCNVSKETAMKFIDDEKINCLQLWKEYVPGHEKDNAHILLKYDTPGWK